MTATFKKLIKVSVTVGSGGGVSVTGRSGRCDGSNTCPAYFDNGDTVTLTAHPAGGKHFGQWGAGHCSGRSTTCTFTIGSGAQTVPVTASFCTPSSNPTNPC